MSFGRDRDSCHTQASLEEYESQKIEEWGRDVEASSHVKLSLPLLTRDEETHYISVNFDPALVRLLRETKYFLLAELQVPESALAIYAQVETFRVWTQKLDMVVMKHNGASPRPFYDHTPSTRLVSRNDGRGSFLF